MQSEINKFDFCAQINDKLFLQNCLKRHLRLWVLRKFPHDFFCSIKKRERTKQIFSRIVFRHQKCFLFLRRSFSVNFKLWKLQLNFENCFDRKTSIFKFWSRDSNRETFLKVNYLRTKKFQFSTESDLILDFFLKPHDSLTYAHHHF